MELQVVRHHPRHQQRHHRHQNLTLCCNQPKKEKVSDESPDTPLLVLPRHCSSEEEKEKDDMTKEQKNGMGQDEDDEILIDDTSDNRLVFLPHHDLKGEGGEEYTATVEESKKEGEEVVERWRRPTNTAVTSSPRRSINPTPEYCWSHIQMDSLVGQGGFSRVFQVHLVSTTKRKDIPPSQKALHCKVCCPQKGDRQERNYQEENEPYYYALKCPTEEILGEDEESSSSSRPHDDDDKENGNRVEGRAESFLLQQTLQDLSMEAELLSQCRHANILRLYGIVKLGGYNFPLLELLQRETLGDCISTWRRQRRKQHERPEGRKQVLVHNPLAWLFRSNHQKSATDTTSATPTKRNHKGPDQSSTKTSTTTFIEQDAVLLERINTIAIGVAQGMQYLHKHHIVMRDLKPDNIGFALSNCNDDDDNSGTLVPKIFDLGFARNVHDLQRKLQNYMDTGTGGFEIAGSPCYMPPEAILGTGVDLSVDVYAFGIVLWELCTLKDPSSSRNDKNHQHHNQQKQQQQQQKHLHCFRRRGFGAWMNRIPCFLRSCGKNRHRSRESCNNVSGADELYHARRYLGWQPPVDSIRIPRLKRLLLECWAFHPSSRPDFGRILKVLNLVGAGPRTTAATSTTSTATTQSSNAGRSGRCLKREKSPSRGTDSCTSSK